MSDQFSEWDKFYARYKRAVTPEGAFVGYRRSRKRQGTIPKKHLSPEEKMRLEYEMRIEKRRVEMLQRRADDAARDSAARASRSTTSDFYAKNGSRVPLNSKSPLTTEEAAGAGSSETKTSSGSEKTKND